MIDVASPDWALDLTQLIAAVRRAWPEHETFLRRRFADGAAAGLDLADRLTNLMIHLAGQSIAAGPATRSGSVISARSAQPSRVTGVDRRVGDHIGQSRIMARRGALGCRPIVR